MAHKFVAMRFGCISFYKIWPSGIFFGLALMLVGIKFVAPGAVVVYPYFFGRWGYKIKTLTLNENGLISLAGPATNLLFAIVFSFFGGWFFQTLTFVNAWLAFFNLLPIPPLDGSKIMEWKIWLWGLMIALAGLLVAFQIF
jgi:Zn-dependent protease